MSADTVEVAIRQGNLKLLKKYHREGQITL
jgi:hypothetical protein